ncbi:acetylornithine aminotransferase [Artomyces pyxidatus]|uniref:Acetylornithine aminotransferase n=1 Tax=Artomyces pyxidatus TaxID=48021 RepID=A0ACB8TFI2_9AGAM|nr:acetylornithine aminotransferase [Artomyces pyxidatus]
MSLLPRGNKLSQSVVSASLRNGTRANVGARPLSWTPLRGVATATELTRFGQRYVNKGLSRLVEDVFDKGEGSWLTMKSGRRVLDFTCGIGVTNLGHCHPKVSKAAADQCMALVHGQCSVAYHEPYLNLIKRLLPMMPDPSLDSFFFWTSGSEAVEGALKMARSITHKQNIITMQGAYHGRTFGAMAVTKSKTIYSDGVAPLMPGVFTAPFPYWHHFSSSPSSSEERIRACLYQVELLLSQQSAPSDTAAILIEPVLGEGGYVPAPHTFLRGLREICNKHGILLIIDEVQSGFGRTGKNFNIEYSGVKPDIMTIAKGLANGFPLSGIVSRKELTDKLKPGSMGGTYAGNAVSCAAAIAVADAFKEEKILENVQARSKDLFDSLHALQRNAAIGPHILDIRGQGLMVAVEFASPSHSAYDPAVTTTAPEHLASRVSKRCLEKGMFLLTTSVYETVRFIPPLNISQEDLLKGCQIFAEAVEEVVKEG